jgi:hypothetical protein
MFACACPKSGQAIFFFSASLPNNRYAEVTEMELIQFAVPARFGALCAEAATRVAGGATLLEAGWGWWVNGNGEIERERVNWLIVGVDKERADTVIDTVKDILRGGGESAVFYVREKPTLEWL